MDAAEHKVTRAKKQSEKSYFLGSKAAFFAQPYSLNYVRRFPATFQGSGKVRSLRVAESSKSLVPLPFALATMTTCIRVIIQEGWGVNCGKYTCVSHQPRCPLRGVRKGDDMHME